MEVALTLSSSLPYTHTGQRHGWETTKRSGGSKPIGRQPRRSPPCHPSPGRLGRKKDGGDHRDTGRGTAQQQHAVQSTEDRTANTHSNRTTPSRASGSKSLAKPPIHKLGSSTSNLYPSARLRISIGRAIMGLLTQFSASFGWVPAALFLFVAVSCKREEG